MRKERKNIFRALFRDPFQPFLQTEIGSNEILPIVRGRGTNVGVGNDRFENIRSTNDGSDDQCRYPYIIFYIISILEATKEILKQIFWKSYIGNGNIVHYTFYQARFQVESSISDV